ncbi:multiheme c-type cytochrome [Limnobacter sp.]|uniref:multiheme c-type cytochrome n=1 Tax=Limnobacter sp. TaxID=2003368 RepID=UPI003514E9DC
MKAKMNDVIRKAWAIALASLAMGQAALAQTMPHQSPHQSVGTVNCASSTCHGSIEERTATPVLQNEYTTWLRRDPHTQAYAVLKNTESQRIAKNLGLKQPAHEAKVCLDCHSHNVPANLQGPRFDKTDGVNCEACHGPAEKWISNHVEPKASHVKNIENGMYPTSNAYAVAKLCTSCHVGDATRPITHQIMGAGHPRISIEVETFLALEPPHYRIDDDWRKRKGAFDAGKIWAMGQFATSANLLELIADPKRNRQGIVPELMMFDCHACHSPMSRKDWSKDLALTPGQPRINNASLIMVQAVLKATAPSHEASVRRLIEQLHVQSTSPAASMQDVERTARALNAELDRARAAVMQAQFTEAVMEKLLRELVNMASSNQYPDYASAEQAYMSISSVANGLANKGNSKVAQAVNARMGRLLKLLNNDEQYNRTEFQKELLALKAAVGG